jgi:hypothetical protein
MDSVMNRTLLFPLLLCLALSMAAGQAPAAEVIYRWVDQSGVIHFGDRPPAGVEATIVNAHQPPASRQPSPEPDPQDQTEEAAEPAPSYAEQRRQERAERRREFSERQRQVEAQCELMRRQLEWVEPSPRVLVNDEEGNPRRLTDEEREGLISEARSFIAENCD